MAVEFRSGTWFNEKNADRTLRFLEKYEIPFVMVDEPQTKTALPPIYAVTSPELAVVRFHGRRTETWEAKNIPVVERFRYLYDDNELGEWVPRVRQAAEGQERPRPDEQLLRELRDHQRPRAGRAAGGRGAPPGSLSG